MNAHLATVRNDDASHSLSRARQARPLPTPAELYQAHPLTESLDQQIQSQRDAIRAVLNGQDDRLLVVAGPCSLHDPHAALAYGERLARLGEELGDRLLLVMRAYVEKPRTTTGWKGLLYDPGLDDSQDLAQGLRVSRGLLMQLADLGLPIATELLSPLAASYLEDTLSWAAIGARTTESQIHREIVSGLDMPAGLKNGTDGDIAAARDAMRSATAAHAYLGSDAHGHPARIHTAGNPDTHLVLRGGRSGPNYQHADIARASETLAEAGLNPRLMIDCSHANSGKDAQRQAAVVDDLIAQRRQGQSAIAGVMLESHLNEGKQALDAPLRYGVSVTDACMGWAQTEQTLRRLAEG